MSQTKRGSRFAPRSLFYQAVPLCLILLLVCSAFDSPKFLAEALNSDLLLPASLIWDIGHRGWAAVASFQLPRIPSFIPDLALFGATQAITGSWRLAYFTYAFGALALTSLFAARIARQLSGGQTRPGATAFLAVAAPILGVEALATRKIEASVHLWLFMPVSHGGAFILSLAAFLALKSWMDRPALGRLLPLSLLTCLGVISDKLCLVFFVVPALLLLLLLGRRWRLSAAALLQAIGACAAAILLASLGDALLLREPDLTSAASSLSEWSHHGALLGQSLIRLIAPEAPLAFLLGTVLPLACFFGQMPRGLLKGRPAASDAALFWWLAALLSMGGALLACSLLFIRLVQYRYLAPFLWWPILWTAIAVQSARARKFRLAEAGAGLSLLLLALHFFWSGAHRPALFTWRDPLTSCLMALKQQGRLTAGLAEYWFARYIEVTSDWQLQVQPLSAQGALYFWGDDPYWSLHDLDDPGRPPRYDFLLVTPPPGAAIYGAIKDLIGKDAANSWREENRGFGMERTALQSTYGEPLGQTYCPGSPGLSRYRGERVAVWLYGPDNGLLGVQKRAPYFARHLPIVFPPETFAANWPQVETGALRSHPPAEGGAAFYGPSSAGTLLDLPSGHYRLKLGYRLTGAPSAQALITADYGRRKITTLPLPATGEDGGTAEIDLVLDQPGRHLDIIVTLPSEGDITLRGLRVEQP